MKCCNTRSLRLHSLLIAAAACGCVSQGTFEGVSAERDQLRKDKSQLEARVRRLEDSSESLQAERVLLIDEMEDLRVTRESLTRDVQRLTRSAGQLEENLAARETELASREAELASTAAGLAKLRGTYDGLVSDLEEEVAAGQIEIEQLREGLRLNLAQEILFPSGSATLNAGGIAVLRKVAERLRSLPNHVEVQGHTDNIALRASASYPSNWELAAARSAQVVRLFVDSGVSAERLSVVSFGEHAPVASNETPEGRAKNRRIEIRLQPAQEAAPVEAEPPGQP
jgi:chemotaxis protein MotB